ncbi:MAG TPA: hypothetical protein VGK50_02730 [Coriobacteriia bacterium]|jgi:hypothetical protein
MRRILYLLVGACLALGVGLAGAYFTSRAEVPGSVIRAGSVAVSAEPTSAALSIEALAPGAPVTRPLVVVNDGNLPVTVVVTAAKKAGITDFYNSLTCTVTADGASLYEGSLSALSTTPLAIASGSRAQMQFAIGLPENAGNDLAGDYAKLSLYVDAEQVH